MSSTVVLCHKLSWAVLEGEEEEDSNLYRLNQIDRWDYLVVILVLISSPQIHLIT